MRIKVCNKSFVFCYVAFNIQPLGDSADTDEARMCPGIYADVHIACTVVRANVTVLAHTQGCHIKNRNGNY